MKSESACGARNLIPLSRFPSGESRGGKVPPKPPKTGDSPHKRGFKALR